MIFVDTSFRVALRNRRDAHHAEALQLLEDHAAVPLVTTNHVRGETWTFLRRRSGHGAAVDFLDAVRSSPRLEVMFADAAVEDEALRWLRRHDERSVRSSMRRASPSCVPDASATRSPSMATSLPRASPSCAPERYRREIRFRRPPELVQRLVFPRLAALARRRALERGLDRYLDLATHPSAEVGLGRLPEHVMRPIERHH